MDTILELLQDCQKKAIEKGIDCTIDVCFNKDKEPVANIKMYYTSVAGTTETHVFETTFSNAMDTSRNSKRISRAYQFISTITDYQEE